MFGEQIPVRSHIYTINGFSAHATRVNYWLGTNKPAQTELSSSMARKIDAKFCDTSRRHASGIACANQVFEL